MRAIIVDDEPLALELLERRIKAVSNIIVEEKFTHFHIEENHDVLKKVDIIFLDIEMPGKNGLELAEIIATKYPHITIIFVTAYNHYAAEAFELNAVDYLLKPIQETRLEKTLQKVATNIEQTKALQKNTSMMNTLMIHVCTELEFILPDNRKMIFPWRTARAKELFLYLLHHKEEFVRKTEIIDILWEDFNAEQAYAQLYTTIYHIRNTLKAFQDHILIKNVADGYVLMLHNVLIDVDEWEQHIDALPPLSEETIEKYEDVMQICNCNYLDKDGYMWAESERFRLKQKWKKYAQLLADYYYDVELYDHAEVWLNQIHEDAPEDEDAHFLLMKIYAKLKYGLLVDHQYSLLLKELQELGLTVRPEVQDWYDHYMKKK